RKEPAARASARAQHRHGPGRATAALAAGRTGHGHESRGKRPGDEPDQDDPRSRHHHPSRRAQYEGVMGTCERIIVLNFGQKLAEGPPAAVSTNAEVIRAYLGEGVEHA